MKYAQTGKVGAAVSSFLAMAVAAGLLVSPLATASPLFDGSNANAWVINDDSGEAIGSFDLGGGIKWSNEVSRVSNSTVVVAYDPIDSNQLSDLDLDTQSVLINQTANSLPKKAANLPDVSLTGIGLAVGSVGQADMPALELSPSPGVFDQTIGLSFDATVGRNTNPETPPFVVVHWLINGGAVQQFNFGASESRNLRHTIYLVDDGVYSIEFWASQNGNVTAHQTQRYTLLVEEGARRDTDGDGIPDKWEAENGLNPLQDSSVVDSDGDGWTDFDEIIRGTDPFDNTSKPADTDLDGWADFDEELRDTNPNDIHAPNLPPEFPDKPTARRLYEVEMQLKGDFFKDASETVIQLDMDALSVMDVFGDVLYLQRTLPEKLELLALVPPLVEADLPLALQASKVETALAEGALPQGLRVPVGNPIVIRGVHLDVATGEPENWAVKAWVDNSPDLHPRDVTAYLDTRGTPWVSSQDWEDGLNSYLKSELVRDAAINLSPKSGLGIHLLEAAISWASEFSAGGISQLGEPGIAPDQAAIEYLVNDRLLPRDEGLSDLHTQLLDATKNSDSALLPFAREIELIYANTELDQITFRAGGLLVQGNTANQDYVYALRLIAYFGVDQLNDLEASILSSLKTPTNDTDLDGVSNQDEIGHSLNKLSRATNPLLVDTDGDFISDGLDVCALDEENKCLFDSVNEADSDDDGVIDPLDVCPKVSNPLQGDSNQDGIGDACRFYANILKPITDRSIIAGEQVFFESIVTELGEERNLTYLWHFDDSVADSNQVSPGGIIFEQPGVFIVKLDVNDSDDGSSLGTDSREITVLENLSDQDSDDVLDSVDNCVQDANSSQANNDSDAEGDACDDDDDNDGVLDLGDDDPFNPMLCEDADGDSCNDCAIGVDGFGNLPDNDPSNDGLDQDGDGMCDIGDDDIDNDEIDNFFDNCPFNMNSNQLDTDGDFLGNACDFDMDNDGVLNGADVSPLNPRQCEDADADSCDDCSIGIDGFGVLADNDVNNDGLDTDLNGRCNLTDEDDDGDTIADHEDNCPLIPNIDQLDDNNNGIGNVCEGLDEDDSLCFPIKTQSGGIAIICL